MYKEGKVLIPELSPVAQKVKVRYLPVTVFQDLSLLVGIFCGFSCPLCF